MDWFLFLSERQNATCICRWTTFRFAQYNIWSTTRNVLDPLLFLLYINGIPEASKVLGFHLFADDTSLFFSHPNLNVIEDTVNAELGKISDWLIANKLTLNTKKSNFLLVHPRQRKPSRKINLSIDNEPLVETDHAKYLGVLIDNNLSWKFHI